MKFLKHKIIKDVWLQNNFDAIYKNIHNPNILYFLQSNDTKIWFGLA